MFVGTRETVSSPLLLLHPNGLDVLVSPTNFAPTSAKMHMAMFADVDNDGFVGACGSL